MTNTTPGAAPDTITFLANLNSMIRQRMAASGELGRSFGGKRDLYDSLGYKREVEAQDYINAYRRMSLAGRGVSVHTEDTWKRKAVVIDGKDRSDQQQPGSEFVRQWQALANKQAVWNKFRRVDLLGRLGQFAVLLIGCRDGAALDQPLIKNLAGPEGVLYLKPYHESAIVSLTLEADRTSPRYGLPATYQIDPGDGTGSMGVHWSRVLHVAEELLDNEVYGVPALESVWNRLEDLEKVVGGSSEAFWLNIRRGLAIVAREGVAMPTDAESKDKMQAEIDNFVHNLSRVMKLQGVDVNDLGADVVDGYQQFKVLVSVIAADLDIPQRKLIGNEQGERASSQDERNWAGKIRSRQADYAEPGIVRAFIDWAILHGALPRPTSGAYEIEWPPVYEPTEEEEAQTALTVAQALDTYSSGLANQVMPEDDFAELYLGYQRTDAVAALIAEERADGER